MEENKTYEQNQPYGQNQNYQQPNTPQPPRAVVYDTMPMKNNNMAISGLVVGIFALLGCWIPVWNLILSIAGIICSAIGLSRKVKSGMAIGGLVASILALLIAIFLTMIYLAAYSMTV
ncbi:MAG: DUF4190 domain-containing protein [Lachnospiraceae bacterium]|nr:DUF4190 domain-containing protein [Lachnospiraceae bacterium]MDE7030235.1 DUF4190 domain-containing protein [Lachnospiraceae bacterium]